MKKKLIISIIVIAVVAGVAGYFAFRKTDNIHVITRQDPVTGLSIYTNLDYGFSVAYLNNDWEGPVEKLDPDADVYDPAINAVFASSSTLEVVAVVGYPGDTQSFNEFATVLDVPYRVVTIGGLPALRYEYVGPINEEGTLYAKTVMLMFKGLQKGSITMAYQKMFQTESEAKKADISRLEDFVSRITFN